MNAKQRAEDLCADINLLVGFRAADPDFCRRDLTYSGRIVLTDRGVHELVRLMDSLENTILHLHDALSTPPPASMVIELTHGEPQRGLRRFVGQRPRRCRRRPA